MLLPQITLELIFFIFGSCIFSFLNVVIYRVPRKESFVKGFSMCTSCGHRLYGIDMVPIISWLMLKRRCRYCGEKISPRYAMVETLGGITAIFCFIRFGYNLKAITVFAFLCVLTVVAFVDIDTMEIPNGFVIAATIIGVISIFTIGDVALVDRIIGIFSVSVILLVITLIVPGGFGGGDIKLMAATGIFLGWKLNLLSLFLAVLTAGAYGIYVLASKSKDKKAHFAFAPFLCTGMLISIFAGDNILEWYMSLFPYI